MRIETRIYKQKEWGKKTSSDERASANLRRKLLARS